jgi:hypothetical protein
MFNVQLGKKLQKFFSHGTILNGTDCRNSDENKLHFDLSKEE